MNKKLLVTGSAGFIGSNLVQKLSVLDEYDISTFDINDGDICTVSLPFSGIDHVIHLAARTFVPDSWKDPRSFYMTNIQGTANILDFCHQQKSSLTYISAYVYGKPEFLPITEDHPLAPNNPYMHSKVLAESLCEFFTDHYQMPVTIFRPFNIMGPGQREDFLIPYLVRQLLDPDSSEIHVKDLLPKRDFLYLDDLLDAIVTTISSDSPVGIFNVGSGESYSVQQIIQILMDITGLRKEVITEKQVRKNEIPDVRADISRIKSVLGWEPRITFREGLERIIKTYRKDAL
jgi:nucleoside-diphosphate-sugar epimerase